jgi:leader peptidase (prepilin peptidase)/N-methyltransferase
MSAEGYIAAGLALIFGLVIGSFLNVVIYRVPMGAGLNGRSHCPKCDNQIRWYDNIPVVSWLVLRAKCRDCSSSISIRYPAIEALTGLSWLGITLFFWESAPLLIPLLLLVSAASIALFFIDLDTLTLPNVITYPLFIVSATYLTGLAFATKSWESLASAGLGALIYFGFFFLMWFLTGGRGLGFGDVKLAPTLGALIGWFSAPAALVGIAGAFIIGGLPAGIAMATGIIKKGTQIPFGPMLLVGAWVGVLFGENILSAYMQLF